MLVTGCTPKRSQNTVHGSHSIVIFRNTSRLRYTRRYLHVLKMKNDTVSSRKYTIFDTTNPWHFWHLIIHHSVDKSRHNCVHLDHFDRAFYRAAYSVREQMSSRWRFLSSLKKQKVIFARKSSKKNETVCGEAGKEPLAKKPQETGKNSHLNHYDLLKVWHLHSTQIDAVYTD